MTVNSNDDLWIHFYNLQDIIVNYSYFSNIDFCKEAVRLGDKFLDLDNLPIKFWQDKEFCELAVKNLGYALSYIPQEFKSRELCLDACKKCVSALYDVPEQFLDYNFYFEVCKENGKALKIVPENYRDYKMCLEAFKNESDSICYFDEKYLNEKICLEIIERNPRLITLKLYDIDKFIHYQHLYRTMTMGEYFEFIKTLE